LQHAISKQAEADIVVVAACGERANEVVEIFAEFPEIEDPRTGRKLMERTTIIANTSNMPVAAREASVYTAMTLSEYYRAMGLKVLLAGRLNITMGTGTEGNVQPYGRAARSGCLPDGPSCYYIQFLFQGRLCLP
jgi:hypothetical protein